MESADAAAGASPPDQHLNFLGFPREVQKDIFSHCSQGDLICLSLVSKHFRDLAAAQLYRNFHIVFPDEDDPAFDSPIDGLAGGLDTFVTSDYDYAKHLRDLSLDTLSAGDKAETAYKPYLYNVSCGKFMNTLLLLTLRKSTSLESFRWNIRVELSRQVYKALHSIGSLTNLHVRLQAGPSLYETPPPLPFSPTATSSPSSPSPFVPEAALLPPPPPTFSIPAAPSIFYVAPPTTLPPPPPPPKPISRLRAHKKPSMVKEPPTLSGFKDLKGLSVLDIDTLDVIHELKTCIRNSAGNLTKLRLSFSDALGAQARKPPPDIDPDDSDPDDEFQVVPVPSNSTPGFHDDVSGPARAYRAQEERKNQETVLGRIFDVDPHVVKRNQKKSRDSAKEVKQESTADPGRDFINAIKAVSNKLMKELNGTGDFSLAQQDILNVIEVAARKYVASEEAKGKEEKTETNEAGSSSGSNSNEKADNKSEERAQENNQEKEQPAESSLFEAKVSNAKEVQKDATPEDIDIEEPEEQLSLEPQDATTKSTIDESTFCAAPPVVAETTSQQSHTPEDSAAIIPETGEIPDTLALQKANYNALVEKVMTCEAQINELKKEFDDIPDNEDEATSASVSDAIKKMENLSLDIQDAQNDLNIVQSEVFDASSMLANDDPKDQSRRVTEYLRSTRGLALQSLSIYLIPVKASVLSRAVDLRGLRRITLLNVGPQAPIWTHLHKENKESPLPLRKIFTDNVSAAFLTFASQLEELHELFMLERDHKYKPESFAPKTNTTMDQIRRLVLKKHMPTLRRLMIKNMVDQSWDLNEKATVLLCRRGKQLQELACTMGIKAIHTFMQQLSGLASLRALHIIQLRNDDTCVWVMRETKRFLIDNLSHHPHMRLEWISIDDDDRVERIVRPSEMPRRDRKAKSKKKGKGKANASVVANGLTGSFGSDVFPVLLPPADGWDPSSDSEDEEEDGDVDSGKLETIEGIHFYDVWGVKIFKKEMVTGRL